MRKVMWLLLFFLIFSALLVSAQIFDPAKIDLKKGTEGLIKIFIDTFGPIFQAFFGGNGELLFERLLLFVIVLAFSYVVLSRIPVFEDKTAIIWIITLAVSLLATRFLIQSDAIRTMMLPYGVLGVALSSVLPLMIYFFFVHSFADHPIFRRILWVAFLIVFVGIWVSRYNELGGLSWIYFFTGAAALIFLLADGTIRRIMVDYQTKQLGLQRRQDFEREIRRQIVQADDDLKRNVITVSQHHYLIGRLRRQLKAVMKN